MLAAESEIKGQIVKCVVDMTRFVSFKVTLPFMFREVIFRFHCYS